MNKQLSQELPEKPQVHIKTLANALDGLAYILKLPRDVPADRNRAYVINERYEYARWLTSPNVVNTCKMYVDECGMNIHTKRNQAGSIRGTRTYRTVSG